MLSINDVRVETQGDQVLVSWKNASRQQHYARVEAMRSIKNATFDRQRQCWIVPANQADLVYDSFPDASYSYEAICLAVEARQHRHRTLYKNLLAAGLTPRVVNGRVIAVGAAATPVLQEYLDDRPEFSRFVCSLTPEEIAELSAAFAPLPPQKQAVSAEKLKQGELFATALSNAAANQYRDKAYGRKIKRKTSRKEDEV